MSETESDRVKVDHELLPSDLMRAVKLIGAMRARGVGPDEIMATLAGGVAIWNAVMSPDLDAVRQNNGTTSDFMGKMAVDLFPARDRLESDINRRAAAAVPLSQLFDQLAKIAPNSMKRDDPAPVTPTSFI